MKKTQILVVDDSMAIVNSLCAILKLSGFEVDSSFNGSDVLRKLRNSDFDLVICDIEMPGLSGLEFLEKVRKEYDRELDVILMTGFLDHDYFIEAIRLGASDFIRKPVDAKQIVRSIHSLTERKRNRHDYSEFYSNLDTARFQFSLDPKHFSKYSISKVMISFLRQNFQINQVAMNSILICVDEMVYNAFIHGTLGLSIRERLLDHESLQNLIKSKLEIPEIAAKRMHLGFEVDHLKQLIEISVEDDGKGFDYQAWLERVKTEPQLNLDEHGRGIAMLYHLADSLEFSKDGRCVKISKSISASS